MVEFATSLYERAESYENVIEAIPHRAEEFVNNWLRDGFGLLKLLQEVEIEGNDVVLFVLSDAVDYLNHQLNYSNEKVWALKVAVEEVE